MDGISWAELSKELSVEDATTLVQSNSVEDRVIGWLRIGEEITKNKTLSPEAYWGTNATSAARLYQRRAEFWKAREAGTISDTICNPQRILRALNAAGRSAATPRPVTPQRVIPRYEPQGVVAPKDPTANEIAIAKGMLARGDSVQAVAKWLEIDRKMVGYIHRGMKGGKVKPAHYSRLPPVGVDYLSRREVDGLRQNFRTMESLEAVRALRDALNGILSHASIGDASDAGTVVPFTPGETARKPATGMNAQHAFIVGRENATKRRVAELMSSRKEAR